MDFGLRGLDWFGFQKGEMGYHVRVHWHDQFLMAFLRKDVLSLLSQLAV
jgi:hypothetical protein